MQYVWFALIVIVLVAAMVLLTWSEKKTKKKIRLKADQLLEASNPEAKEIKDTIKNLRLYGGRWIKDKEFPDIIRKLQNKLDGIKK